ncbi:MULTISPECIES: hypothetical protein [unclassified Flavobacterium]|uniref:hypothetical protein n=1 Tax=unclassified Flavobacterium TaxID=196869 RepID=UPI00057DF27C|nr:MULTISPECIES: hypothetical protein [unclassified Flavobacterium]KIA95590.1 hypothetical protein OA93_17705 [Flavobacterium sp. KMS]OUL62612.1 hypothetical protein B8T70_09190 [Flavobacterium sp. AJR]
MKFSDKRNSLWQKFDEMNLRMQNMCAHWLEQKTSHFSRLNWIVILFSFIICTGSCSIYLIVTSFSNNTTKNITVIPIMKPNNSIPLEKETIPLNGIIRNKAEFERIIEFRRYLDSLGRSPTGKKMYDSIVQYHPGLLDSLAILENYYNSNF